MATKRNSVKGVITVLIALMLSGILSLGTLALEAGRYQAAKTQLNDATISAATSMLAAYDSILFERYGLLAIDDDIATEGRCKGYLEFNSDLAPGYEGNNLATLYKVDSVEMDGFYNLTYPAVLKRQILSRAKFNLVHQDYSLNYYNMDYFLSALQSKADYVMNELKSVANGTASAGSLTDIPTDVQESLKLMYQAFNTIKRYDPEYNVTLASSSTGILPSVTGTETHDAPTSDIDAINTAVSDAQSVIGAYGSMLASSGSATYTEVDVSVNVNYVNSVINNFSDMNKLKNNAKTITSDCRALVQAINAAINVLSSDKEGNLLLNSYVSGYFPNKNYIVEGYNGPAKGTTGSMNNGTFTGSCVEYAFSANSSEKANQESAYNYIMAVRLVSNLYSTIINSKFFNRNNACSVASHVAWAYYESFADTELLFRYNATVPLEKYSQMFPINEAAKVKSAFASKNLLNALKTLGILSGSTFSISGVDQTNYRDALALALWFVPNSKKMLRVADLIQLEMRYHQQYVEKKPADFLMSEQNTFCRVRSVGRLNSILPVISLNSSGAIKGTEFQSIRYVGY